MAKAVVRAFAGEDMKTDHYQAGMEDTPDVTGTITLPKDAQLERINETGRSRTSVQTVAMDGPNRALAMGMPGYASGNLSGNPALDRQIILDLALLMLGALSLVSFAVARQKRPGKNAG